MSAVDEFGSHAPGLTSPASDAFAVTPNDGADLAQVTRGLWVGVAGDVSVVTRGGTTVTLKGAPSGSLIPIRVKRVRSTGTTATDIVGLV